MPDDFIDGLRARGMGAWRRVEDLESGKVATAGRRVPDRVTDPIPGLPRDRQPEMVIASGGHK
jgi:hypothetical protein